MSKDYERLVLDTMQPGLLYHYQKIAVRNHVSAPKVLSTLAWLCETGQVERIKAPKHRGYLYRLAQKPPEEIPAAAPAYRNLRLTENLTGYSASLTSHMRLCMETRK